MSKNNVKPTDVENPFSVNDIIVSKTNLKGEITYVNDVICTLAEADESEMIGQQHNIILHPDMPRSIFQLLWQQIKAKKEIFAYVKNMAKTRNHYWVFAHVTPTLNDQGEVICFHSSRRSAPENEISIISELYEKNRNVETKHDNRKDGLKAGVDFFHEFLEKTGMSYDEFVWSVGK